MPKFCDTKTTVSGAVTRRVNPNTSANTATEIGDWSTIISAKAATLGCVNLEGDRWAKPVRASDRCAYSIVFVFDFLAKAGK